MANRQGFTIVELAVTVAIIAVLLALILPAVQSSRAAARNAQCRSHLRQIGLAVHTYESAHRMLPPGSAHGYSLHVVLLPQVGLQPLFDQIDFENGDAARAAARTIRIPVYLCPSDSSAEKGLGTEGICAASYAGNFGTGVQRYGYNGLFRYLSDPSDHTQGPIRTADITDGLSQTAALSEVLVGNLTFHPRRVVTRTPDGLAAPDQWDEFARACAATSPTPLANAWSRGRPWTSGQPSSTWYNHVLTPNSMSCTNGTRVQLGAFSAASLHAGGVNVLLADGRVDFVADAVSPSVWRAFGSRNGG